MVNLPGLPPHAAGNPILAAGQVNYRPPDALGDERLELDALVGIELVDSAHQSQNALVNDVIHLCEAGVDPPHLQGNGLHQPHVPQGQGPFQLLASAGAVEQEEVLLAHFIQLRLGVAQLLHGQGGTPPGHTAAAFLWLSLVREIFPRDWICTSLVISLKASTYRLG